MWLAAKYPDKVKTLSLHSAWPKTDPFLNCFTPELYASKPEYINSLADFVRGRPAQPLDAFMRQSNAVIAHDAESQLGKIKAPTQITFGKYDTVTSPRFADRMKNGIKNSEIEFLS